MELSADEVVVVDIFTHRKCQCVRVLRAWPDPTISYTKGLGTHVCILNAHGNHNGKDGWLMPMLKLQG